MKKNLKRDVEFLFEIGAIRFIPRAWRQFLLTNVASISEHTFRAIWLALIIARYERVRDIEKVLKLTLVHDLPESRTGDVNYIQRMYSTRNEQLAAKEMFTGTIFAEEFSSLWREWEARKTIEAKVAKDADNLEFDLEIIEQEAMGMRHWTLTRRKRMRHFLYTKTARRMLDLIHSADPDDWHRHSRNRVTHGDWNLKNARRKL